MDRIEAETWFVGYLDDFAAVARGDLDDAGVLLERYGVPLVLSTDQGCATLADESQVRAAARAQADALRADGYHHSEVLDLRITVVNRPTAVLTGSFARVRRDGSEIARLDATYLLTATPVGLRLAVIAVHSPG